MKLGVPTDVIHIINEVGQYLGYWSGLSQLEAIFFFLSITQSPLQSRNLNPADRFVVFWSLCIPLDGECISQSIIVPVYSGKIDVLVKRMSEFLVSMPIALIAYLFSPRYRGFLLTSCNRFLDEWSQKIREAWDSILQYIGINVDKKMKKEMYNIMETYCHGNISPASCFPSVNSIDCSYWDKVKEWCKKSGRKMLQYTL